MENGQSEASTTKRKFEQGDPDEVASAAATKVKQHDFLAEAAAVFKNARINKLSLVDKDSNVTDATGCLLPTVSSLDDAYRIQVLEL